jgi:hypothetical protein
MVLAIPNTGIEVIALVFFFGGLYRGGGLVDRVRSAERIGILWFLLIEAVTQFPF